VFCSSFILREKKEGKKRVPLSAQSSRKISLKKKGREDSPLFTLLREKGEKRSRKTIPVVWPPLEEGKRNLILNVIPKRRGGGGGGKKVLRRLQEKGGKGIIPCPTIWFFSEGGGKGALNMAQAIGRWRSLPLYRKGRGREKGNHDYEIASAARGWREGELFLNSPKRKGRPF